MSLALVKLLLLHFVIIFSSELYAKSHKNKQLDWIVIKDSRTTTGR